MMIGRLFNMMKLHLGFQVQISLCLTILPQNSTNSGICIEHFKENTQQLSWCWFNLEYESGIVSRLDIVSMHYWIGYILGLLNKSNILYQFENIFKYQCGI